MTRTSIQIMGHSVGEGCPCFVIGEIGLNHNGSVEIAKKLIDVAVIAGCTVVKLQKRDVATLAIESVLDAKDERFPDFGSTYREIRNHLEFDHDQYQELINYARERRMGLLSTAFDIPSVHFLENLNVEAYKIASHSLTNIPLLECLAHTGKPMILSTGMAKIEEVDQAVEIFLSKNIPLLLMHCVSSYPTPIEQCNLRVMDVYRKKYGVPVGYSGHEIGWLATLGAVARGANAVERHITLDAKMTGFDHKLSLSPSDLIRMVKDIRDMELALGTGEKSLMEVEKVTRNKYHVSWVSAVEIKKGQLLTEAMMTLKNPGTGIPAYKKDMLIGKKVTQDIPKDVLFDISMVET